MKRERQTDRQKERERGWKEEKRERKGGERKKESVEKRGALQKLERDEMCKRGREREK